MKLQKQIKQLAQLLHCVRTLERATALEIANIIGCSDRTIRSYIEELRALGAPIEGNRDGYRLTGSWDLAEALSEVADHWAKQQTEPPN